MKKLAIVLFSLLLVSVMSCKKDTNATEAEITEPVEVKEAPVASHKFIVDTTASVIEWKGSKPTGSHSGILRLAGGNVFVSGDSIESGRFIIDMTSITVTDPEKGSDKVNLENHLKGLKKGNEDHFFNTIKFPVGTFEITAIKKGTEKTDIEGNLTLKEITKNIGFPAAIQVTDSIIHINSESFKINRTLWNINYSSKSVFENLGNEYIDDDIEVKVKVVAKKQ